MPLFAVYKFISLNTDGLRREIKIIGRVESSRIWARISFMCSNFSHTNVCDSWYIASQHHQSLEEVYLVEEQEIDVYRNNKHVKSGLSPEGIISYCDEAPRPPVSTVTSRDQLRTNDRVARKICMFLNRLPIKRIKKKPSRGGNYNGSKGNIPRYSEISWIVSTF